MDSADNKNNIANFFCNQKKTAATEEQTRKVEVTENDAKAMGTAVTKTANESRETTNVENGENNAPQPVAAGTKRPTSPSSSVEAPNPKALKTTPKIAARSPTKLTSISSKQSKSSTTNQSVTKPVSSKGGDGSKKITSFFGK